MKVLNANDLADQLKNLLSSEIGSFQTESGFNIPAIWIEPPILPTDYKSNGLSCFIQRFPELANNTQPVTGESKYLERYYTVTLRQYSNSNSDSVVLTQAIEKIVKTYPNIRPPVYVPLVLTTTNRLQ